MGEEDLAATDSKSLLTRLGEFAQNSVPVHVWIFFGIIIVAVIVDTTGALALRKSINGHKKNTNVVRPIPIAVPKPENAKPILPEPDSVPAENHGEEYEEALPEQVFEPQKSVPVSPPKIIKKINPVIATPELANTWRKNAVKLAELPPGPQIAIVIDDAGLDRKRTAAAINLPGPLTIAFLTYAGALPKQASEARKAGHEIMVHMAMEPFDKSVDPGPNVLQSNIEATEILKRLTWGLDRFAGYVGINNHMGSRFTADPFGMNVVMRELKRRGLLFVDSRTSGQTVGVSVALANDVPFTQRNIFLDNVPTVEAVNKQLHRMEIFAKHNGTAVAIGHPRDATIMALSQWLAVMAEKGFVLVPISTIVAKERGLSPLKLNNPK
jgi:hypothetical protein